MPVSNSVSHEPSQSLTLPASDRTVQRIAAPKANLPRLGFKPRSINHRCTLHFTLRRCLSTDLKRNCDEPLRMNSTKARFWCLERACSRQNLMCRGICTNHQAQAPGESSAKIQRKFEESSGRRPFPRRQCSSPPNQHIDAIGERDRWTRYINAMHGPDMARQA